MGKRIIRFLTIIFIVISILFLGIGLYGISEVTSSSRVGGSIKILVFVMITFCISYGFLSFIIIALILRESYKLIDRTKRKRWTL